LRSSRTKWGISHIYTQNESDLFFAQGYNVAHNRLLQLELWRRQSTGTVAEVLGKKELRRDIGNRLFMYRGDLTQELNWSHPRGAAIIQSFVNGINAYIGETRRNPALLTPEFRMLDLKPDNWTPAVVISRFNGLLSNVTQELNMALAVRTPGADRVKSPSHQQTGAEAMVAKPSSHLRTDDARLGECRHRSRAGSLYGSPTIRPMNPVQAHCTI
jgi:penicillin amidase